MNKKVSQKRVTLAFFALAFMITVSAFASAQGLTAVPSDIDVEKLSTEDKDFNFTLVNQESFEFQNITFEENNHVEMSETTLQGGGNQTIIATATGNSDFEGLLAIKGFYQSNLGEQDKTWNVTIDSSGIDQCQINDGIEGDQVIWNNTRSNTVVLVNSETGNTVEEIGAGETHQMNFDNPQNFEYHLESFGTQFSNNCNFNARSTSGYTTNPDYDAEINMNIDITFPQTTLSSTIPKTQYEIEPFNSQSDVLSIENTGNETARNIDLEGEWFSFSKDDFNLEPGESTTLSYTITPSVSNTNETNQSYSKDLSISGNFDTINKTFDIFVEYQNIDDADEQQQIKTLEEIVNSNIDTALAICSENPQIDRCSVLEQGTAGSGSGDEEVTMADLKRILNGMSSGLQGYTENEEKRSKNIQQQVNKLLEQNESATLQDLRQQAQEAESTASETKSYIQNRDLAIGLLFLIGIIGLIAWYMWKRKKHLLVKK